MLKAIATILDVTLKSVYNYKKEKRPVITLFEKYFTKDDLEEFLNTGRISKYESSAVLTVGNDILLSMKSDLEEIKSFLYLDKSIEAGAVEPSKETKPSSIMQQIIKLMDISKPSYYVWKREGRPVFKFLETYFTSEEIEEFLNTSKMTKLEAIREIDVEDIQFILENKDVIRKLKEIKGVLQ